MNINNIKEDFKVKVIVCENSLLLSSTELSVVVVLFGDILYYFAIY